MVTVSKATKPVKDDDLWLAQARLAERRHEAERDLIGSILADPATLVPVARDCGIEPGDFWSGDTRIIFCTMLVAADLGKETVIRLAKRALLDAGSWDATAPAWYAGELHSDATLAALADSYPVCPAAVRLNARRLLDLSRRQCRAQDHINEAAALLDAVAFNPIKAKPKLRRSAAMLANPAWRSTRG